MLEELRTLKNTISNRSLAVVLKTKHKTVYDWVLSNTDNTFSSFSERVHWLLSPVDLICKHNNRKKFSPSAKSYGYCGSPGACKCHNEAVINRAKSTTVFGTDKFLTDRKVTWTEKYGVDNPQKLDKYKDEAIIRNTGKTHTKEKIQEYLDTGFDNVISRVSSLVTPVFDKENYKGSFRKHSYEWKCITCSNIFFSHVDYGTFPKCNKCFPKTVSLGELEIREYLDSLGIEYVTNTKDIIPPMELDIFVPSLNVAIEYNGIYWHSDKKRDSLYHVNKYLECKNKGIHLIQIFEDQWKNTPNIIRCRLRSVLKKDNRIFARKCSILEIDNNIAKQFVNQYHLQGWVVSKINIGLFYNNDLVGVMTFGPARFNNDASYELLRFCSIGTIVGGANKIFSYFIKKYKPTSVISYADRCWSNGNLYRKLGFEDITLVENNTGYFYVKDGVRYHRSSLTKNILIKRGHDPAKTADEILDENNYLKIYNCGNYKFVYRLT